MKLHYPDLGISFLELNRRTNRATPNMMSKYRLSLLLYTAYNEQIPAEEWLHLYFNQVNTRRPTDFKIIRTNRLTVGKKTFCATDFMN